MIILPGRNALSAGKLLLEVNHKNGPHCLVCQDRECGYRRSLSKVTNAPLSGVSQKDGTGGRRGKPEVLSVPCGYREKLSTFQERKKESGSGVSKRDVANYMKRQRQEE